MESKPRVPIRGRSEEFAAQALREHASYADFLAELLESEREDRDERREFRRVKKANFPGASGSRTSTSPRTPMSRSRSSAAARLGPGRQPAPNARKRHAIAIASNRPFTEWDQTFTDKRLCQAGSVYEVLARAASGRSW
ncbi:hypothetical protein ACFTXM_29190 [Streptomyces sp. NPDC056930]|uniref:hypothetical protein n=1 Tax=Streptomyces sp. NPDC056930 TaxID=3345967 RepID=UPI00362CA8D5